MSQLLEHAWCHRGVGRLTVGNLAPGKGTPVFTAMQNASLRLIIVCTEEDSAAILVPHDGCLRAVMVTCDNGTDAAIPITAVLTWPMRGVDADGREEPGHLQDPSHPVGTRP